MNRRPKSNMRCCPPKSRSMTSPVSNSSGELGPPGSLSFQQGDPTWQRYRQRALTDLYWFADVVLNYGERVPMRKGPHALLCKFAEKRTGIPALDNAPRSEEHTSELQS